MSGLKPVVLVLTLVAAQALAGPLRPISLQLKWKHQFQFAGYYAAVEEGFFAEEGLDVTLLEADPTRIPLQELTAGRVDFAVADADALLERMHGAPVVVVAAVFQHSPYVLITLRERGIVGPGQFVGRKVMDDLHQGSAQVRSMLRREGIDLSKVEFVDHTWKLDDLIEGRVDVVTGYSTVEPGLLRARGFEPVVIDMRNYGVDFYGDCLYALEPLVERDPQLVHAMTRALRRGWEWAFAHVDEEARRILARPGVAERGITLQQLHFEAEQMRPLVLPDVVEIGHMNPGRWEHIASTYVELGAVPAGQDWRGFIFDPEAAAARRQRFLMRSLAALGLVLVLASAWTFQLRRVVRRRTAELEQEAARRLEVERTLRTREAQLFQSQKLEALGQLAGGVAHDFNNLLTVVNANVALLQQHPAMRDELLPELMEAGQRGAALVRQLLSFGRRTVMKEEPLELTAVMDGLAAMLRRLISPPVELRFERASEPLPMRGDKALLEQLVVNLAVNARDAMPEGGTLLLRTRLDGDRAVLEVVDSGVGMPPEVVARIFEPFFTTKAVGRGTGLGLSIAWSVVEQHRGQLSVDSTPGKGTTFRAAFPRVLDATVQPVEAPAALARGRPGELVLVVDDEAPVRRAMAQVLERAGWQTREAADGPSALALADDTVKLVVSDVRMPGMNGVEFVAALRARRPGLPALLVSGGDDVRGTDVPFLQKPWAPEALCREVRRLLDAA